MSDFIYISSIETCSFLKFLGRGARIDTSLLSYHVLYLVSREMIYLCSTWDVLIPQSYYRVGWYCKKREILAPNFLLAVEEGNQIDPKRFKNIF